MDKGNVVDIGKPYDLIKDKTTILYDLVKSLDKSESDRLIEIAKKTYNHTNEQSIHKKLQSKEENKSTPFVEVSLDTDEPCVIFSKSKKTFF